MILFWVGLFASKLFAEHSIHSSTKFEKLSSLSILLNLKKKKEILKSFKLIIFI